MIQRTWPAYDVKYCSVDFLKGIGGKVVGGVVALGVVVAAIMFWQAGPEGREVFLDSSGKIVAWTLGVLVVPWALFAVVTKVARMDSNAAGGWLIAMMTLLELTGLWWMFDFGVGGPVALGFFVVSGLLAAAYNLLACDFIADRLVG